LGKIFTKFNKNSIKFLRACFTVKEGANGKNLGSITLPKARGVPKSLFRVSIPKETEDMTASLPCIGQAVH